MRVYPELASFAGNDIAVYVGARSFSKLSMSSLRSSLDSAIGQTIQLAAPAVGVYEYAVKLDSAVSGKVTSPPYNLHAEFALTGQDLSLRAVENLQLTFSLVILDAGKYAKTLSTLILEVKSLKFSIDAARERLFCEPGDATLVPSLQRAPDFDATVKQFGLDADTTTRVEGMLLYSGLASAITRSLSVACEIDLLQLFPGISFQGRLSLQASSDRQFLFIKGALSIGPRDGACKCPDPGNGIGQIQPGTLAPDSIINPNAAPSGAIGTVRFGGPTPVTDIRKILGRRSQGQGDSGLYMPNAVAEVLVGGPFPAVRVDVRDNGFIGWKAAGIVDFSSIRFSPDVGRGRFFVELEFRAEVYGSLHIDFGKLGKVRVTEFSAEQAQPGGNKVNIGFYLVLGSDGLFLKPVLEDLTFADFNVHLRVGTIIGTPFGFWGAVYGYIFDTILEKIIGFQIPIQLDHEIRKYMQKAMFTLLDASYAATLEGLIRRGYTINHLTALYDGGSDGLLISAGITD